MTHYQLGQVLRQFVLFEVDRQQCHVLHDVVHRHSCQYCRLQLELELVLKTTNFKLTKLVDLKLVNSVIFVNIVIHIVTSVSSNTDTLVFIGISYLKLQK